MTKAATEISKTDKCNFVPQSLPSNIDPVRQYGDVAKVGQSTIASAAENRKNQSLFSRANDNIKSWFKRFSAPPAKESIASTSPASESGDSVCGPGIADRANLRENEAMSKLVNPSSESKKSLVTQQLVHEIFCGKTANYETQLSEKAALQNTQLLSQQRLQRTLNAISDLPETGLNQADREKALTLILAARSEGIEWAEKVWTRKYEKQNLEEEIRLAIDDKQSRHPLLTNQYMQISQEKSEFTQMCLKLVQSPHDTIIAAARAIGR